ncbi:MAG TPA: hypothetical protein VEY68_13195 [Anoxybacillus sp.]|nr:hypothetical protein [Anoxybacillus sp.]
MANALVRKIIGDVFEYDYLPKEFKEDELAKYKERTRKKFRELARSWNTELNTEWLFRHYLSVKMILATSVMLTSIEFAKRKNLKIVEPYLLYYALLTASRGLIFTIPDVTWNNGEIVTMTHKKIINVVSDLVGQISKEKGEELKNKLSTARDYRELFSYKFPASGTDITKGVQLIDYEEAIELAALLAEIAQFNSEQLEYCIERYCENKVFEINLEFFKEGIEYKLGNVPLIDREDLYRLDYIFRKQRYPLSLYFTMTEGLVEDFFGSWCPEEETEDDVYNPDENWRIIFPVP